MSRRARAASSGEATVGAGTSRSSLSRAARSCRSSRRLPVCGDSVVDESGAEAPARASPEGGQRRMVAEGKGRRRIGGWGRVRGTG